MDESESVRTIRAVERACRIIDTLEREHSMGVTALAEELDLAKGTVHPHLSTLEEQGYVVSHEGKYQLSVRYIGLSETVKERTGLCDRIRDELDKLAQATGERVQFATEEDNRAVYVYRTEGDEAIPTSLQVGQYAPLHCVAIGKAMLAYYPEDRVEAIIEQHGLPQVTEQTITDRDVLKSELEEIRDQGYAIDNEEQVRGVRCIAAPLQNDDGTVFGAISLSGPARRMTDERLHNDLRDDLLRTANVIEVNTELS